MELAKGGELFDRLAEMGSLGEREAGRVMEQVGRGQGEVQQEEDRNRRS